METLSESTGPTFTASGRQVRSRYGGVHSETTASGRNEQVEHPAIEVADGRETGGKQPVSMGRTRQSTMLNGMTHNPHLRKHIDGYNTLDEMDGESDASSSGGEWDGDDDEVDDHVVDDEDDDDADMSEDDISANNGEDELELEDNRHRGRLVVALRYQGKKFSTQTTPMMEPDGTKQEKKHFVQEHSFPKFNADSKRDTPYSGDCGPSLGKPENPGNASTVASIKPLLPVTPQNGADELGSGPLHQSRIDYPKTLS